MTTEIPDAQPLPSNKSALGLTIGELARRTGQNAATLRMWETRHGFPRARRLPSGHRRYDEVTAERVRQVLRLRDSGVRLEVAIAQVNTVPANGPASVYAELRQRHPGLQPHRLRKSTLLALTWALEDECCSRAQSPWLFGAFQQERFYRKAEARWRELARTSRRAWAMADFAAAQDAPPPGRPVEVALPETSAMRREWSVVCHSDEFSAALAAWELPGQERIADGERLFESLWTLDPAAVRDATRCSARVVSDLGHDAGAVLEELDRPASPSSGDLRDATTLFNRVIAYVDRVR